MTEKEKYVYIGYGINSNKLVDSFIKLSEIDDLIETVLMFAKANKYTYGIGEIVDITEKEPKKFNVECTGEYLKENDELIKHYITESFANEQAVSINKELVKLRRNSTSVENMTLKDIIDCTSYTTRKGVITYLLSRL